MGFDTPDGGGGGANVPDWSEDGNSPVSESGAATASITLADAYDEVMLRLDETTGSVNTTQDLQLLVNGDTGTNYFQRDSDGGSGASNTEFALGSSGDPAARGLSGSLLLLGRWGGEFQLSHGTVSRGSRASLLHGSNGGVTSPLDSLTLQWSDGTITTTFEVFGRDIG